MAVIATLNTLFTADVGGLETAFSSVKQMQSAAAQVMNESRGALGKYADELDRLRALYEAGGITTDAYNQALARARTEVDAANPAHQALNKAMEEGARVTEMYLSPLQVFEHEVQRLDGLLSQGAISQATYNAAIDDARSSVTAADPAVQAFNRAMEEGRAITQSTLTPYERFEQEIAQLDKLLDAGAISFDTWSRALSNAHNKLAKATPQVSSFRDSVRGTLSELKSNVASNIVAAFGIREMGQFVAEGFAAVDTLNDIAAATGATTQQLAALHVAAGLNASSTAAVDEALSKLNKTLSNAEDSDKISGSLEKIGLSAEQLRSGTAADAFVAISEGMMGITDPVEKARIATDLFGKSGTDLINVLALGRDGFESAAAQAQALGLSITGIEAEKVGEAVDAVDRMKMAFDGLAQQAAITFAPIVEWLANAIPIGMKMAQANFAMMAAGITNGVVQLLDVISYLPDWLGGGMAADTADILKSYVDEFRNTVKTLDKDIDVLRGKGAANTGTFTPMAEAAKEVAGTAEEAAAGWARFTDQAKGLADFFGQAAENAEKLGAQAGVQKFGDELKGLFEFGKAAANNASKMFADKGRALTEDLQTPLETFEKTMSDLTALKGVGAIDESTFARAQAKALNELDQATRDPAANVKVSAIERGTAAAFSAEREGKDPAKTQKDILEQAKKHTTLQEGLLAAFKEGGAVPVNF